MTAHKYSNVFNNVTSGVEPIYSSTLVISTPVYSDSQITGDIVSANTGIYTQKNILHITMPGGMGWCGSATWECDAYSGPDVALGTYGIRNFSHTAIIPSIGASAGGGDMTYTVHLEVSDGTQITWVLYTTTFLTYTEV